MNWLGYIWHAFKMERKRRRRWRERTCYTWKRTLPPPSPDVDRGRNVGSWS